MEFLSKTCVLWHRQFVVSFVPRLRNAFTKVFTDGAMASKFIKEHYQGAHKAFVTILKRYYTSSASSNFPKTIDDNYHLIASDVAFNTACTLLRSDKLEQRVAGIKEISEQLKNTRFGMLRRGLSDKDILARLIQHNILEQVFGGAESHVQLVQRGEELLRFMIDQREFNENEIRIVWNAA